MVSSNSPLRKAVLISNWCSSKSSLVVSAKRVLKVVCLLTGAKISFFFFFFFLGYRIVVHSYRARKLSKTPDEPEVRRNTDLICKISKISL